MVQSKSRPTTIWEPEAKCEHWSSWMFSIQSDWAKRTILSGSDRDIRTQLAAASQWRLVLQSTDIGRLNRTRHPWENMKKVQEQWIILEMFVRVHLKANLKLLNWVAGFYYLKKLSIIQSILTCYIHTYDIKSKCGRGYNYVESHTFKPSNPSKAACLYPVFMALVQAAPLGV